MDPDSTTTIGDEDAVKTDNPFQSINAVDRTSAKFSTWASDCRGLDKLDERDDNMAGD